MKKILLTLIFYIFALGLYFLGVNFYINNKVDTLSSKAYKTFNKYFNNQRKYIDTFYSNHNIKFSKCNLPEKKIYNNILHPNLWEENFSDIISLYKIDDYYDGWQLFAFEALHSGCMYQYNIYPSYIGLKFNTEYIKPTIENCLNEAYEFYTTNQKSNYYEFYKKGNKDIFYNILNDVSNEYFYMEENNSVSQYTDSNKIGNEGYMYDYYQKTFVERTKYKTYEIKIMNDVVKEEKMNKLLIGIIILTIIFISLISYFIFIFLKNKKINNETLYDKLKRLCNPAKFMKPYNEKKVAVANTIYEQLLKTDSSDTEKLKQLRQQAIDELNCIFVNKSYIESLTKRCNPKKFTKPYNPEKVQLANLLYNKVLSNPQNIEILEEIENEIKLKLES